MKDNYVYVVRLYTTYEDTFYFHKEGNAINFIMQEFVSCNTDWGHDITAEEYSLIEKYLQSSKIIPGIASYAKEVFEDEPLKTGRTASI